MPTFGDDRVANYCLDAPKFGSLTVESGAFYAAAVRSAGGSKDCFVVSGAVSREVVKITYVMVKVEKVAQFATIISVVDARPHVDVGVVVVHKSELHGNECKSWY